MKRGVRGGRRSPHRHVSVNSVSEGPELKLGFRKDNKTPVQSKRRKSNLRVAIPISPNTKGGMIQPKSRKKKKKREREGSGGEFLFLSKG